ncbi:MAG: hypothetical protein ACQKBV_06720 [Puniceicoccales bacterium]
MNLHTARTLLLKTFIGFLGLTALIAIVSVLIGEWGTVQLKTLATTFTISSASICAMACAAYVEKRGNATVGWAGAVFNFLAAAFIIFGVWAEYGDEHYWKAAITFIVLGLSFAHACLMHLPRLAVAYQWTQTVVAWLVALLGAMILAALWIGIDAEGYYRLLAVVSIVAVLFTLVIPILMKLSPKLVEEETLQHKVLPEALMLTLGDDGLYRDASGAKFRVQAMENDDA